MELYIGEYRILLILTNACEGQNFIFLNPFLLVNSLSPSMFLQKVLGLEPVITC